MLFLLENAQAQNDFRHFTEARRTFITCFRRVMIIFRLAASDRFSSPAMPLLVVCHLRSRLDLP